LKVRRGVCEALPPPTADASRARALSPLTATPSHRPNPQTLTAIVEHETDDQPAPEEVLIGWKGETWQPPSLDPPQAENAADAPATTAPANATTARWIELLSWRPRAFLYHGFLSHSECDHIIHLTEGRVSRSGVVDAKTGKTKLDPIRTSTGAALARGQDATVAEIERRASEWTRLPANHAEAIQVLRYENGQTYRGHFDWFDDPVHKEEAKQVGNRIATVLLYLSEVEEGGATTLPLAFPANASRAIQAYPPDPKADKECAGEEPGMGIAVRPRKGGSFRAGRNAKNKIAPAARCFFLRSSPPTHQQNLLHPQTTNASSPQNQHQNNKTNRRRPPLLGHATRRQDRRPTRPARLLPDDKRSQVYRHPLDPLKTLRRLRVRPCSEGGTL
jgi:prolyl 4-hydroxylase